ncbi:MarR family transcriptional regulator [Altererythrobacter soli]|uniref:MarR family transcriptional regulator n=1 Tax=Croceibacterium soli TaxID=1739690 RepID=A0A6I4UUG2_9SPHN|nr:MarR family transcriptional regulator [Croceibacterium soli]MXP42562.1 MarR family transcriptional regulator [Croceibacterium soli]
MDRELTFSALKALRRILRASELSNRQLATETGLTPSQLLVLQEIGERGEVTPTELSAALQFGQATITNIVDRLEALELVTRQRGERDKRRIHVAPTADGMRRIETAPNLLQARLSERFAALPEWEQAMILAGLSRLADLLGTTADAAPLLDSGAIDRSADD